mmetsp:Transcript_52720/g.171452  ORF Transcript_52720/g.171452 Transcript_52720/m.171452 type:complete len:260 (-) Transcript_52720:689-1468(-)
MDAVCAAYVYWTIFGCDVRAHHLEAAQRLQRMYDRGAKPGGRLVRQALVCLRDICGPCSRCSGIVGANFGGCRQHEFQACEVLQPRGRAPHQVRDRSEVRQGPGLLRDRSEHLSDHEELAHTRIAGGYGGGLPDGLHEREHLHTWRRLVFDGVHEGVGMLRQRLGHRLGRSVGFPRLQARAGPSTVEKHLGDRGCEHLRRVRFHRLLVGRSRGIFRHEMWAAASDTRYRAHFGFYSAVARGDLAHAPPAQEVAAGAHPR